jgi:protein BUR2
MGSFHPPRNGHVPGSASPMVRVEQSQWLFTAAELQRAPSILEGMPPAQELTNRAKGVNFITQVGIALKLPQLTLATACVYLHRFFMRHSMPVPPNKPGIHHYSVAATALFLATKVEENCRKMKELVVACCRVAQKNQDLVVDEQDKEFWRWRDTILTEEDRLLEALCFDLQLDQPYRILFDFMCYYKVQDNKPLRNAAWAFLNDSYNTTMCLRFPAKVIAGVALYGGAAQADVQLPDDRHGRPWWDHLELDILDIKDAWNLMAERYEQSALPQQGEKGAYARSDDLMTFDKTRSAKSPTWGQSPAVSAAGSQAGMKHERDESDQNGGWGASPKRQRRDSGTEQKDMQQSATRIPPPPAIPPPPPNGASSGPRIPPQPTAVIPAPNGPVADPHDVQRRIDDIINAAPANPPPPPPPSVPSRTSSHQEQQYPPLSRQPSCQDRVPPPPRSTSSSSNHHWQPAPYGAPGDYGGMSNRQRPPSSQGSGHGGYGGPPALHRVPSADSRPPVDYSAHPSLPRRPSFDTRRDHYDQGRRKSQDYRPDDRPASQQGRYGNDSATNGIRRPDEGHIPDNGSEEGEL